MPRMPALRMGEIWDVGLNPVVGHEQGGLRSALIVSNDNYNITPHGLCLVVPITGTFRDLPSPIPLLPPEGGLAKSSVLLCEQVRAASILRLRRRRGVVNADTLVAVHRVVEVFLDEKSWSERGGH